MCVPLVICLGIVDGRTQLLLRRKDLIWTQSQKKFALLFSLTVKSFKLSRGDNCYNKEGNFHHEGGDKRYGRMTCMMDEEAPD